MARSFAQPIDLTCLACGRRFVAQAWLIVDAQERPDLLTLVANDTLHSDRCPHCGTDQSIELPLLFHRADDQTLILAMPEGSSHDQIEQAAQRLGSQLIASIPVAERQPYLARATMVTGLDGLRHALSSSDALSAALPALMQAGSPQDVQRVVADHPILASHEAQRHLREYVERLHEHGHHDLASAVEQRIAAFAESTPDGRSTTLDLIQTLLDASGSDHRRAVLHQHAATIGNEVPSVLAALADQARGRGLDAVARDLRGIRDEVLDQIKQHGDR